MRANVSPQSGAGFVIGIGIDLVDIRRISHALDRFGLRFRQRLFSSGEIKFCDARVNSAAAFARHYAAKEACSKALGTGMSGGVSWRDIALERDCARKPRLHLYGGAHLRLDEITPEGFRALVHLSLTDEPPYAAAIVTLSATPL